MIKIEQVFSIKEWEIVQDSLAETTGMAILMVDYKGRPITKHSCCCEFCDKVRSDEVLKKYCEKCDSRGGAEAVRQNKPYIYKCCFGMVDVAIPIVFKAVSYTHLDVYKRQAYKMKLEALKHQGVKSKTGSDAETADLVGKEAGDSGRKVQRYIRLTELLPELLELVDRGKIKVSPAVSRCV